MQGGQANPAFGYPPPGPGQPQANVPPQHVTVPEDFTVPNATCPGIGMVVFGVIYFIITIAFTVLATFPIDTFICAIIFLNCGIQALLASRLMTKRTPVILCLIFAILSIIIALVQLILASLAAAKLQYAIVDSDAYRISFGILVFLAVISVPPFILSLFLSIASGKKLCGGQATQGVYVSRVA